MEEKQGSTSVPSETAERILRAFLKLVAERGIEATTTRALAEEARVNEVTIFRNFKDKATLVREAYRHFAPGHRIAAYPLAIDASNPERAMEGLVTCLKFLRDSLREHPQLLLSGLSEYLALSRNRAGIGIASRSVTYSIRKSIGTGCAHASTRS